MDGAGRKEEEKVRENGKAATAECFRRRDEWRKHSRLSNQLRHALPGFGLRVTALGVYLDGEQQPNVPSKD